MNQGIPMLSTIIWILFLYGKLYVNKMHLGFLAVSV